VYKLERNPKTHLIERMRIALDAPLLATGLDDKPRGGPKKDRELGEVQLVNEDRALADAPAIACGSEGCFMAWHGEQVGAFAAQIDPVLGKVLWRKRFADKVGHPTVAVSGDGEVVVAFFDQGRLRVAALTRDGVGPVSTIAKVSGEQPRPWLAPGRTKGEWLIGWQDSEALRTEVYVARAACH
jgi:hypothetical protein